MFQRSNEACERALSLDPNRMIAASQLITNRVERGELGKAYEAASRLYVPVASGAVCRAFMVRPSADLDQTQATTDRIMNDKKFRELLARLSDCVEGPMTEER